MKAENRLKNADEVTQVSQSLDQYMLEQVEINEYKQLITVINAQLFNLLNPLATYYSEYDADNKGLQMKEIKAEPSVVDSALKIGGKEFFSTIAPVNEEMYDKLTTDSIVVFSTLTDLTGGANPESISESIGKTLKVKSYLRLAYMIDGQLYGTSVIALKDAPDHSVMKLLKIYAYYTSMSLKRILAEEALKQSEQKLKIITDNMTDLIAMADVEGKFTFLSENHIELFGYENEELLGRYAWEILYAEDMAKMAGVFTKSISAGEGGRAEYRVVRKDGTLVWVDAAGSILYDNGEISGALLVTRDISDRKKAEEALSKSEQELRTIATNMTDVVAMADVEGRFTYLSESNYLLSGYKPSELLGKNILDLIHEDDLSAVGAIFQEGVVEGRKDARVEYRVRKKDDDYVWVETIGSLVLDDNGQPSGALFTSRDISDRKHAQEQIERLAQIADSAPSSIVVHDYEGNLFYANEHTFHLYDYEKEEFLKLDLRDISVPESAELISARMKEIEEKGEAEFEVGGLRKDGSTFPLQVYVKQTEWFGKPALLSVSTDITLRKQDERIIQSRLKLLEFSTNNSLNAVLQKTLDEVCSMVGSPIGFYHFVSPDEKELTLKAWSTDTIKHFCEMGTLSGKSYSVAEAGVWVDCIKERKPVIHNDYNSLPHRKGMPEGHAEVIRELVVPIMSGRKAVAILGVGNKSMDYNERDIQIVTFFADLAWIIAERKQTEELLKENEEQLRLFFDHMLAGVAIHEMIYDQNGNPVDYRFLKVNRKFEELTGLDPNSIIGKTVKEVLPDTEQYWIDTYGKVAQTGGSLDYENYSVELDKYFSVVVFSPRQDRFATVFIDITERKVAEDKIIHIGFHDQLTDLYNRHYFEACEEELKDIPVLSVIMTDVNGLKLINDTYGHEAGDELLKKYAELLKKSFKQSDLIFRWGGDEFIVILKNTEEAKSWELCNRLVKYCGESFVKDIPLSISVGISSKLQGGNIDEAIKEAEDMMYKNKLTESKSSKNLIMKTLQQTLAEKSFETKEHIDRMTLIGRQFGAKLGLSPSELSRLETLTMLHDIGKINIDSHILLKETALNDEEWEEIKKHPEVGYRITRTTEEFAYVAEDILAHHERWDGKGYPQGLEGESIPYLARLLNIIDSYDVMSNGRPYKKKMSLAEVIDEIERCLGKQFDPDLAGVFVAFLKEEAMTYQQ